MAETKTDNTPQELIEIAEEKERKEEANLEAMGDKISRQRTTSKMDFNDRIFRVKLGHEYEFSGQKISDIDLSGLDKLSTLDMQRVDRIAEQMGVDMEQKYTDTLYCKHIAMAATGLPVEFFNMLKARDMAEVVGVVRIFFTLG